MKNKTKEKLRNGGFAIGHFVLEFATPGIGHILANAGCDYVIFDMEHSSLTQESIRLAILSARAAGITPVVRVPNKDYHLISRPLDAGAQGIMVPWVETKEQVERIIESVKYPPQGKRGAAFSIAHDDYSSPDMLETIKQANEENLVIIQTETAKAVDNVDELLSVEGVDVAWVGQCDLSISLGIPGQYDHPDFQDAFNKVLEACKKHEVAMGYIPLNLDEAVEVMGKGVRCISYSADIFLFGQVMKENISSINKLISGQFPE
ncbi:aldolase [Candidatus Poribacteria bacterium]|nr:aldolase [Candidatus Poribacteria bacterium]